LYVPTTSAVLSQTVNRAATTTILTSSLNPSISGQAVTFTATVTANAPGGGVPSGSVIFTDGSTNLGTVSLNSSGVAAFTTSTLSVGQHNIKARYLGNSQYVASISAVLVQTVNSSTPSVITNGPPQGPSILLWSPPMLFGGPVGLGTNAAASGHGVE